MEGYKTHKDTEFLRRPAASYTHVCQARSQRTVAKYVQDYRSIHCSRCAEPAFSNWEVGERRQGGKSPCTPRRTLRRPMRLFRHPRSMDNTNQPVLFWISETLFT